MSARDTHLLSGAYVLHAVTEEEALAVETAMAESDELRAEVVGLADTAVTIGLAVPAVTPPSALRSSVLAAIADAPQLAQPILAPHVAPRRRRRRIPRPALLLAAGALAVAMFGGGVLVQRALIQPQLDYNRVVAAADARPTPRQAVEGGGTIVVTTSRSEGATAVSLDDVHAPAGDALQLWILHGDRTESAGLYQSGDTGQVIDRLPAAGDRLAVSVEPAGGSKQPTTIPIVVVSPS